MPIPDKNELPKRINIKDLIYDTLVEWIVDGTMKSGEKISDSDIAEYFKVSRTPVREVFKALESQKLIESFPCRSTVVASLNTGNIEEYYLPVTVLQSLAASMASQSISGNEIKKLEKINDKFSKAVKENNTAQIGRLDLDFHNEILEIAGNKYVCEFSKILMLHIRRLDYIFFKNYGDNSHSVEEHKNILEALKAGDYEKSGKAMEANWKRSMESLKVIIQKGEM